MTTAKTEKRCRRCDTVKPRAEFHRHSGHKDGLQSACAACGIEQAAKWNREHPEQHAEASRPANNRWYEAHRDEYNARRRAKYAARKSSTTEGV